MKKTICILTLMFALTACSLNDVVALLVTPTVPPPQIDTSTPTVFYTPSQTPTITPVPSFTSTPTLVGFGNGGGVSTDQANPLPTLILIPTTTPGPQVSLLSDPGSLIVSLSVSSDVLYWGYCDVPEYVDFNVRLANNIQVVYVLLFMRLVDKSGYGATDWGGGAIMKEGDGSNYSYRVTPDRISRYNEFRNAWVEYQIVVTTYNLKDLASSPVYRRNLSLEFCLPVEGDE
ncbi:MAG: hypothetical protein PVJ21_17560 [Anaerolineales bacterium]|jgi:hypothetical protein